MRMALSEHLPRIAAAPDGIQKLRGLILELAVRGKLVPQDPNDEPASKLLKEMATECQQLESSGVYRKAKSLPVVTDEEISFDLPTGWSWIRLGQVGNWGAGATPSRSNTKYYGGSIPWFKSGELTADFISDSEESVTDLALKECSLRNNQPGDVLIAMYGATIGKTAILSTSGTTNQAVCACTPYSGLFNRYLLNLLKALKANFIGQGAGGAQPNISREKIVATVAALPPLAEQHRIVAKVDELMALCDRLESEQTNSAAAHAQLVETLLCTLTQSTDAADFEANWKRIAEHFDTLFTTEASIDALQKTVLQLAVMGKLVLQDKNEESAKDLLDRISAEAKSKNSKQLTHVPVEAQPYLLPTSWEWTRFGAITDTRLGKMLDAAKNQGALKPYLRNTNVQWGRFDLCDIKEMRLTEGELNEFRLLNGDLLICEGGEPGRCAIWQSDVEEMYFQKALHRARPRGGCASEFLQILLNKDAAYGLLSEYFTGATIKHFTGEKLSSYVIPLPPVAEQQRIVAKVDELMAVCESLKNQLAESRKQEGCLADTLIQASLKAA